MSFPLSQESISKKYFTSIPNGILSKKLTCAEFYAIAYHFYSKIPLPASTWRRLLEKEVAEEFFYTQEQIVEKLKSKQPQHIEGALHICEWCDATTFVLHVHHYPIPKCKGGTETVDVCANCHCEYHFLKNAQYRVKSEFMFEVNHG